MINVNMTEKAGVTLATAGKYCADNVKVTPSAEILRKDEQAKSATPTETAQDITPDSGKVLSKVSVGAIPKTYVGSGVTKKAAATVSPSTSEQTVCASGVYTTGEQKVSAITPSIVGNLDASSFAASIVSAIEGKGVDVPSGSKLDALAALIESIEAGVGGGEVTYGTITPADMNADTLEIEHGLGVKPKFVLICAKDNINNVYSRSSPDGQSFIYAIEDFSTEYSNDYYSRYQNTGGVGYSSGAVMDSIGTGLNYYIAISDTSIIWAKRNTSYGFGYNQSSFFWVALKEV